MNLVISARLADQDPVEVSRIKIIICRTVCCHQTYNLAATAIQSPIEYSVNSGTPLTVPVDPSKLTFSPGETSCTPDFTYSISANSIFSQAWTFNSASNDLVIFTIDDSLIGSGLFTLTATTNNPLYLHLHSAYITFTVNFVGCNT